MLKNKKNRNKNKDKNNNNNVITASQNKIKIYEFKFSPVQPFVEASRNLESYHASSLFLSTISYLSQHFFLKEGYLIMGRNWNSHNNIDALYQKRITTLNLGFPNKFVIYTDNITLSIDSIKKTSLEKKLFVFLYKNLYLLLKNININTKYTIYKTYNKITKKELKRFILFQIFDYFKFSLTENPDKNFDKHNSMDSYLKYVKTVTVSKYLKKSISGNKCDFFTNYDTFLTSISTEQVSTIENISFLSFFKKNFLNLILGKNKSILDINETITKPSYQFDNIQKEQSISFLDGDKIGALIKNNISNNFNTTNNFFIKLNQFLDEFIFGINGVVNIIKQFNKNQSTLIYAGGDDIVFMSLPQYAWKINLDIRNAFFNSSQILINYLNKDNVTQISISSAVVIFKEDFPLSRVNKTGHNLLTQYSKSHLERDAITFYFMNKSSHHGFGQKWSHFTKNSLQNLNLIDTFSIYFKNNIITNNTLVKLNMVLDKYLDSSNDIILNNQIIYETTYNKNTLLYIKKLIDSNISNSLDNQSNQSYNKSDIINDILELICYVDKNKVYFNTYLLKSMQEINNV